VRSNEPLEKAYPSRRALNAPAFPAARVGLAVAGVACVVAILVGTGVIGGSTRVDTSSPSYRQGNSYGAANFASSRTESSVCATSHARPGVNPTLWLQGCHDAWAVAAFKSTRGPLTGGGLP